MFAKPSLIVFGSSASGAHALIRASALVIMLSSLPFHLGSVLEYGPATAAAPSYLALGTLAALATSFVIATVWRPECAEVLIPLQSTRARSAARTVMAALLAFACVLCAIETVTFPEFISIQGTSSAADPLLSMRNWFVKYEAPLLFAGSFSGVALAIWLDMSRHIDDAPRNSESPAKDTPCNPGSVNQQAAAPLTYHRRPGGGRWTASMAETPKPFSVLALAFTCGLVIRALWALPYQTVFAVTFSARIRALGIPCALPILVAFCTAIVLCRSSHKLGDEPWPEQANFAASHLAAFSLGTITWSAITHLTPVVPLGNDLKTLSVLLGIAQVSSYALVLHRASTSHALTKAPDPCGSALLQESRRGKEARERLSELGLTGRVLEVASLSIAGITSKEIGARLGISASTVRVTLLRARQLTGSKSNDDLASLALRAQPHVEGGAETARPAPIETTSKRRAFRKGLSTPLTHHLTLVSWIAMPALLFAPPLPRQGIWALGLGGQYGIGVGAIASCILLGLVRKGPLSQDTSSAAVKFLFPTIALLLGGTLLEISLLDQIRYASTYPLALVASLLSSFLLTSSFLLLVDQRISYLRNDWKPAHVLIALIVAWLSGLSAFLWAALATLSSAVVAYSASSPLYLIPEARSEDAALALRPLGTEQCLSLLFAAMLCGAALGESWRALGGASYFALLQPCLAFPSAAWILSSRLEKTQKVVLLAVLTSSLAAPLLCEGLPSLSATVFVSLSLYLAHLDNPEDGSRTAGSLRHMTRTHPYLIRASLFFFGVGILGGSVMISRAFDYLFGNASYTFVFGGKAAFQMLVAGILVASNIGALISCKVLWRPSRPSIARGNSTVPPVNDSTQKAASQAPFEFLRSKGLNETQAKVIMLACEHRSVAQIAEELSYAQSTVRAAKSAGLRKLNASSIDELEPLFHEVNGQ